MSNLTLPNVTDLDGAREFLGERQSARLGHNTRIRRDLGGDVSVTHHDTAIVTYANDGRIILRANGWVSATTATRLHALTPERVTVRRKDGNYIVTVDGETETWNGYGELWIAP